MSAYCIGFTIIIITIIRCAYCTNWRRLTRRSKAELPLSPFLASQSSSTRCTVIIFIMIFILFIIITRP